MKITDKRRFTDIDVILVREGQEQSKYNIISKGEEQWLGCIYRNNKTKEVILNPSGITIRLKQLNEISNALNQLSE